MRELLNQILAWKAKGKEVAIATNVRVNGTSLRPLGSKMAMTRQANINKGTPEIAGSVTGGCIEGAVYEEAQAVLKKGQPKLQTYGIVDEDKPWEIGLTCGSSLEVFVESMDSPGWHQIMDAITESIFRNQKFAILTTISGDGIGNKMLVWQNGKKHGSLGSEVCDAEAVKLAGNSLREEMSQPIVINGVDVFVDVITPPARLIVIGAVHIAIPLVQLAKTLGFHTIIIDPRVAFATRERFPEPYTDDLLIEWPSDALKRLNLDAGTIIAALSHDEKLDNPALAVALNSPAPYVGVLGTRKKIAERKLVLAGMGVSDAGLDRLRAPIGMDLKAVSPEEIALSILAEIVAVRHGKI